MHQSEGRIGREIPWKKDDGEYGYLGEAPASFPTYFTKPAVNRYRAVTIENLRASMSCGCCSTFLPLSLGSFTYPFRQVQRLSPLVGHISPFTCPTALVSPPEVSARLSEAVKKTSSHACWSQHIHNENCQLDAMIGSNKVPKDPKRTVRS